MNFVPPAVIENNFVTKCQSHTDLRQEVQEVLQPWDQRMLQGTITGVLRKPITSRSNPSMPRKVHSRTKQKVRIY